MVPKKMKQCVCCGFNSSHGTTYNKRFVCSACERERLDEEERRYEDEEATEAERLGSRAVERF